MGTRAVGEGPEVWVQPHTVDGRPKAGWRANLLLHTEDMLVLRAPMQHPAEYDYATFAPEDTVIERYWLDRWYNILTLYGPDGRLKGWYANICMPPSFDGKTVCYTDLDLDLWVWPDRRFLVLDEQEFAARVESGMPPGVVERARAGLAALLSDLAANGPLFRDPEELPLLEA